jgi:uncharacterized protein YkwD
MPLDPTGDCETAALRGQMRRSERRKAVLVTCVLLGLLTSPALSQETNSTPSESGDFMGGLKRRLFDRINRDRREHGVAAVRFSRELSRLADLHCREMLAKDYIGHWNLEGWKPYMRYSQGGVLDHTEENIASIRSSRFDLSPERVERELFARHEALVNEEPPFDLHRKSILEPTQTHVGIGLAFNETGMRLIEVFAKRYVEVEAPPASIRISDSPELKGTVLVDGLEIESISVFYEPPPPPVSRMDPSLLASYGFPPMEISLRPRLPRSMVVGGRLVYPQYEDGSRGEIQVREDGVFACSIPLFLGRAGVYTIVVWLRSKTGEVPSIAATNITLFVEE